MSSLGAILKTKQRTRLTGKGVHTNVAKIFRLSVAFSMTLLLAVTLIIFKSILVFGNIFYRQM